MLSQTGEHIPSQGATTGQAQTSSRSDDHAVRTNNTRHPQAPASSFDAQVRAKEIDDLLTPLKTYAVKAGFHPTALGGEALLHGLLPEAAGARAAVQSASYALEALTGAQGARASSFGLIVVDDRLSLWHYGPCGIVYTNEVLSLIHHFETVAAVLVAIAMSTPERFGAIPSFVMKPGTDTFLRGSFPFHTLTGHSFVMQGTSKRSKTKVTLQDPVATSYTITGRRPFVYTARTVPSPATCKDGRVIVKLSYQLTIKRPEHELIERARLHGVGHLPAVHASVDLWTLPDNAYEISERGVVGNAERAGEDERSCEDRVLRAIAYTEYGCITRLFPEHPELIPIMVDQMIDCASTTIDAHTIF